MIEPRALAQARLLVEAERYADALAILVPHVAGEPDDARAWCLIAQCKLGLNDAHAADEAARTALGAAPDLEWAHRIRAITLSRLGSHWPAREEADEAVRLAPAIWLAHRQRAEVDIVAEDVDDRTYDAAARAVELAPHEPAAHITLGRVHLANKDNGRAEASFREALRLDPSNAVARNNLAVVQMRRRRLTAAARHFTAALRLQPNSPLFASNLRVVLRAWAAVLDLAGVIGCFVLLNTTGGHDVTNTVADPNASTSPGLLLTVSPTEILSIPADELPPNYNFHHVAATGRPAILLIVPAIILFALLAISVAIRRSIGPRAAQIVAASLRTDSGLRLAVGISLLGVVALLAAPAVGLPAARVLVGTALAINFAAAVVVRVTASKRRRSTKAPRRAQP